MPRFKTPVPFMTKSGKRLNVIKVKDSPFKIPSRLGSAFSVENGFLIHHGEKIVLSKNERNLDRALEKKAISKLRKRSRQLFKIDLAKQRKVG